MRVGAYVRLSQESDGLGVQRQEDDCRALAQRKGWELVEVYADPDNSAYKRKPRPAFERLLSDLGSLIDGIVVWDVDRLARQPRDLERLLDLYEAKPFAFATCQGELDLSTSDGRFIARLLVNVAHKSSSDTARRIKRKHLELVEAGIPVGGYRPFGWDADRRTICRPEADHIRQAVEMVLAGYSLHAVGKKWNELGLKTTAGNIWRHSPLKNTLTNPRLAGFRTYRREIARINGEPIKGQWEPILDVETWQAVCAMLASSPTRKGAKRYLLSGIMRCGLCGAVMSGNADTAKNTAYYACKKPEGCAKIGISQPKTDALITELVLRYLGERTVEREVFGKEAELTGAADRLAELMRAFTEGKLTLEAAMPAINRLEDEISELRREQATTRSSLANPSTVSLWPQLDLIQQRQILSELLTVVASPAKARGGKFDPNRLQVAWKSETTSQRSTPERS